MVCQFCQNWLEEAFLAKTPYHGYAGDVSIVSEMFCNTGVQNSGLQQESKMRSVNENLNQLLKAESEMLLNSENSCAQRVSRVSEMLDSLQCSPAQSVSRMSKMTKLYFIKKQLNQPTEMQVEMVLHRLVQNEGIRCPKCPKSKN